jgi:hypothetical protein
VHKGLLVGASPCEAWECDACDAHSTWNPLTHVVCRQVLLLDEATSALDADRCGAVSGVERAAMRLLSRPASAPVQWAPGLVTAVTA